ncbi:MAG: GDSL-type esterase/lipase family protein, partial [Bacteroidota bacterium]
LIHTQLEEQYDWVTLLIGVNNHYRGLSVAEFSNDLSFLVHKCIQHCRHQAKGVWLLSIPDWTVTPFASAQAEQRDRFALADFNEVVRNTATSMGIHHIDITEHSQKVALEPDGLCPDGLHYSGKTHGYWASLLEAGILTAAEM